MFRTLELGLVDEAKDAVEKWMARWIEVVSQISRFKSMLLRTLIMLLLVRSQAFYTFWDHGG